MINPLVYYVAMTYYVDQSGKIEDTAKSTVLAFSDNSRHGSIMIKASDKRSLQVYYRDLGKPRLFIIQLFSVLLARLIDIYQLYNLKLVIDREYIGQETLITSYVTMLINANKRNQNKSLIMRFGHVGKTSDVLPCIRILLKASRQ